MSSLRSLLLMVLALWIAGCSSGAGSVSNVVTGTASGPAGPLEWVEFHDVDGATLEGHLQDLGARGYRLTSLAISGTTADPRYVVVLVKQEGPAWSYVLGVDLATLTIAMANFHQQGLYPAQVVAVGPVGSPAVYAARVEAMAVPNKWAPALTQNQFLDTIYPPNGSLSPILLNFEFYHGLNSVCAVWQENGSSLPFSLYFGQDLADARTFSTLFGGARYRRAFQTVGDDTTGYSTLWTGDSVPGQRDVDGLDQAGWEAALQQARADGLLPLNAQAGGAGASTVYTGSFARAQAPAREWTVTGVAASSQFAAFDTAVQGVMQKYGIRAATLAVGWQGRLVAARGYTWAESGYPITQATTTMRIASVSKPVTTVAIHQLIQDGLLTYDTPVQPILNLQTPAGGAPSDPRFADITIGYLLNMLGGWDADGTGFDPMFADATVAQAFNAPLPVTKYMIASYMAGQTLDTDPGTSYSYSNFGFSLLGQVLERLRPGYTYTDSVKETIWGRLGATRPFLVPTSLQTGRAPGEAEYQESQAALVGSVMTPDQPLVPIFYGGENVTNMDSHGGWVLAACDYVKMLTAFDQGAANPLLDVATTDMMFSVLYPNVDNGMAAGWFVTTIPDASGTQQNLYNWAGLLDSDSSVMMRRADGLSIVLLTNQGTVPAIGWPQMVELNDAANSITDWGTQDLFPAVGLPSF